MPESLHHTETNPTERVQDLFERFWKWRLLESPEYGTRYGVHDNDHLVEEYTEEAFLRQKVDHVTLSIHYSFVLFAADICKYTRTD